MRNNKRSSRGSILPAIIIVLGLIVLGVVLSFLVRGADVALLDPKGMVANEQHDLLITSTLIMLAFAVPVALAIYFFAWHYREGNSKSTYNPVTKESKSYLAFAWGGPIIIVAVLAAIMIPATHRLAHQAPIESENEPITVQVVALNWKWLFIYPEHDIATLNFAQIPVDTPVRFELTADGSPMNSFWIPHLGGMLYAMSGHVNPINLISDSIGDYPGSSAEINGRGFASMRFITRVSSQADFDTWVAETKESPIQLNKAEYEKLLEPSENNAAAFYNGPEADLYNSIVKKYAGSHGHSDNEGHGGY